MRIERQEFSIYTEPSPQSPSQPFSNVRTSATASREEGALLGGSDMSGLRHVRPRCCPICGAHDMLLLSDAIAIAKLTATALKEGLETGRYHLHCSNTGDWWVCGQSMRLD